MLFVYLYDTDPKGLKNVLHHTFAFTKIGNRTGKSREPAKRVFEAEFSKKMCMENSVQEFVKTKDFTGHPIAMFYVGAIAVPK